VDPQTAKSIIAQIIEKLTAFRNPYTGTPVFDRIYRKEEIYADEEIARAPEILLVPKDGTMAVGTTEFLSHRTISLTYAGSGWHRMEGVFIAHGQAVRPGHVGARCNVPLQIVDLFPILVAALGVPIPRGLDGRVPEGLLEVPVKSQHERVQPRGPSSGVPNATWEKEIRERLKSLGYV
jgi:predicted AlkP superfamily phosphohydrolase/phosphomutase